MASDFARKKGLLYKTDFFRAVLDEGMDPRYPPLDTLGEILTPIPAHRIKSSFKTYHTAVSQISATRRWCITGTPIQNGLGDLGSIVSYLRVPLLEDRETFHTHIIKPSLSEDQSRFDNLRLLLGCICLRRTKASGGLVDPKIETHYLTLSRSDAEHYNGIVKQCRAGLNMALSMGNGSKAGGVLETIVRLRAFCNTGIDSQMTISPRAHNQNGKLAEDFVPPRLDDARCTSCFQEAHGIDTGGFQTKAAVFAPSGNFLCCLCITSVKRDRNEESLNVVASTLSQTNDHSSSNVPLPWNLPQQQQQQLLLPPRPPPPGSVLSTRDLLKTHSFPPYSTKLISLHEEILKQPPGDKW